MTTRGAKAAEKHAAFGAPPGGAGDPPMPATRSRPGSTMVATRGLPRAGAISAIYPRSIVYRSIVGNVSRRLTRNNRHRSSVRYFEIKRGVKRSDGIGKTIADGTAAQLNIA